MATRHTKPTKRATGASKRAPRSKGSLPRAAPSRHSVKAATSSEQVTDEATRRPRAAVGPRTRRALGGAAVEPVATLPRLQPRRRVELRREMPPVLELPSPDATPPLEAASIRQVGATPPPVRAAPEASAVRAAPDATPQPAPTQPAFGSPPALTPLVLSPAPAAVLPAPVAPPTMARARPAAPRIAAPDATPPVGIAELDGVGAHATPPLVSEHEATVLTGWGNLRSPREAQRVLAHPPALELARRLELDRSRSESTE